MLHSTKHQIGPFETADGRDMEGMAASNAYTHLLEILGQFLASQYSEAAIGTQRDTYLVTCSEILKLEEKVMRWESLHPTVLLDTSDQNA